jgi:hypothetical protein
MTSIPRTLASAKRQGFKSVDINENALTTAQRASRIDIVGPGAKTGHIVSIIQDRDDPNSWLVKYIDSSGGFTYVRVPKGQPIPPDP